MIKIKVGDIFHGCWNLGKPYKCYVLAIVDKDQIVFRYYGRRKQYWHYDVKWIGMIEVYINTAKKRKGNED